MANTENIEAKLCAYIDGDLDAQGRAEIEKHLAANPQHRTLIEQLSKQRDLLRELPRENAPEEILDALQSHMERAVLLGDADAAADTHALGKISRWPQLMAAAAIVLLTVGLGLVIYMVLPRHGGDANYARVAQQPGATLDGDRVAATLPASGAAGSAARVPGDEADRATSPGKSFAPADAQEPARHAGPPAADAPTKAKGGPGDPFLREEDIATADAAAGTRGSGAGGSAPASPAPAIERALAMSAEIRDARQQLQNADLARQLKQSSDGLLNDNAMFLVVDSADPSAARSEVTNYLASNKIAWDAVAHPVPQLDVAQAQDVDLSRAQNTNVRMKSGGDAQLGQQQQGVQEAEQHGTPGQFAGTPATGAAAAVAQDKLATDTSAPAKDEVATQRAQEAQQREAQQPAQQAQQAPVVAQQPVGQPPAPPASAAAPSGASETAGQQPAGPQPAAPRTEFPSDAVAVDEKPLQAVQQSQLRVAPAVPEGKKLIIARGMTKQQAAELSINLSKQTAVQRAAVYEQRPLAVARRSRDAIAGPTTAPSLAAPDAARAADASPTTAPSDLVAAGATPATTAQSERASVTEQTVAAVAPEPAASAPATTPAEGLTAAPTTTTAPAPIPLTGDVASAAVAAPTTAPSPAGDDERVDVVILVQDDLVLPPAEMQQQQVAPTNAAAAPDAAPSAAPTTAPAAHEPAAAASTQPAPQSSP